VWPVQSLEGRDIIITFTRNHMRITLIRTKYEALDAYICCLG